MDPATSGSLLTGGGTPTTPPAQHVQPSATTELPSLFLDMDDDLKGLTSIQKFARDGKLDARALARGYANAESLIGRDKVPIPKTDEDWDRWYAAAGRPEAPDKYEFKRPDKLPDGMTYDEEKEKSFRVWAHMHGLNAKQANGIYEAFVRTETERHGAWYASQAQARQTAEEALKREWGQAYDGKLALARGALKEFADPDFVAHLESTGLGNDPRMVRWLAKVGERAMGETALKGDAKSGQMTPRDIEGKLAEMREKNWDALSDKGHPDHRRLNQEYTRYFEMLYPSEEKR
ncbi:MAG: hypothetical protein AB1781_11215 [Pseudomonadota bacterium]